MKSLMFFSAFSICQISVVVLFEDGVHAVAGGTSEHKQDGVLVVEAKKFHGRTVIQKLPCC